MAAIRAIFGAEMDDLRNAISDAYLADEDGDIGARLSEKLPHDGRNPGEKMRAVIGFEAGSRSPHHDSCREPLRVHLAHIRRIDGVHAAQVRQYS